MFVIEERSARSVWPGVPVTMPLRVLLALAVSPRQVALADYTAFNVAAAIHRLLGHFGRDRMDKVLKASVWAPSWDEAALRPFLVPTDLGSSEAAALATRVTDFPGTGTFAHPDAPGYPRYEIVHLVGAPIRVGWASDLSPVWPKPNPNQAQLNADPDNPMHPGALRDALVAARTRLCIFQTPELHPGPTESVWEMNASAMAEDIVGAGGPAVLVVGAADAEAMDGYFMHVYADIVHNIPLRTVLTPPAPIDQRIRARLYRNSPDENLLRFDSYMDALARRLADTQQRLFNIQQEPGRDVRLHALRDMGLTHLHARDAKDVAGQIDRSRTLDTEIHDTMRRLADVQRIPWHHEHEGVVPLSEIIDTADAVDEAVARAGRIESEVRNLVDRAPRVLNANFADAQGEHVLEPAQGIIAAQEYVLLVDVGPRWTTIKSVVTGSHVFPESSLPPDRDGYEIQVALVSDDFSPNLVTAAMWVPRGHGRSSPIENGEKRERSGPVKLPIRAPSARGIARGRLALYHENNLIQSARVAVPVVDSSETRPQTEAVIEVDYVLSGTLHDASTLLRTRAVRFTDEGPARHAVGVNVTLNDDGNGDHRIIVKFDKARPEGGAAPPPPAWTRYNPVAAVDLLQRARQGLLNCFLRRDRAGALMPNTIGLDANNGKTFDAFRYDLRALARLGAELFKIVTGEALAEGGALPRDWTRALRDAVKESAVIQVARTRGAEYAFPWALVYDHPMPGPKFTFCQIVDEEWKPNGVRKNDVARTHCPYDVESWHAENVYCPYGFWGFRHIVEQPPSALVHTDGVWVLRDVTKTITTTAPFDIAIALTSDAELDAGQLNTHVARLKKLQGARVEPPTPVGTATSVRAMLAPPPAIVYFLCHGERDVKPFLGIGPRDQDLDHRIYPDTVQDWTDTAQLPNLAAWARRHPLIFINGCHTCDLSPKEVLNFVTAFSRAAAAGILGTEVKVILPVATEVAESILGKLVGGMAVGEALHRTRWELLNKGNILGLAYTLYALADLRVIADGRSA